VASGTVTTPVLNLSAATTVPKLTEGGAFMWDRKKSQAASPLISCYRRLVVPDLRNASRAYRPPTRAAAS
jgi:hypothetical protein